MAYEITLKQDCTVKKPDAVSSKAQKDILYGDDIRKNLVPAVQPDAAVRFYGKCCCFGMTDAQLSRMTLLVGGNGYGKTNVISYAVHDILQHMSSDDFMLIFDTKGDNFERFYCAYDERHMVVGGGPAYRAMTRYWNIYDELRNEYGQFDRESEALAKEIMKQIGEWYRETTQPFFPMAAAEIIAWVIIDFIREAKETGNEQYLNNGTLVKFLRSAETETYHKMTKAPGNEDMVGIRKYLGTEQKNTSNQALGVYAYIHQIVDDLFVGIFGSRGKTKVDEFSIRQLIHEKGGKVLFLEYDLSRGETLTPIYRILVDLALKEAMGGRRKDRGNFYLIADEFRLLPKLHHIQDGLNFGRSLGIKILAGIQSIHQLADAYGENAGKVIAAGFTNWICFNTPDFDTRKLISERFGTAYYNLHFRVLDQPLDVQKEGYAVEDWDILELAVGEAYVSLAGYQSFRFSFEQYEKVYPC